MGVLGRNKSAAIDHEVLSSGAYGSCVVGHLVGALNMLSNRGIEASLQNHVAVAHTYASIRRVCVCLQLLPANRCHLVRIENAVVRRLVLLTLIRGACP